MGTRWYRRSRQRTRKLQTSGTAANTQVVAKSMEGEVGRPAPNLEAELFDEGLVESHEEWQVENLPHVVVDAGAELGLSHLRRNPELKEEDRSGWIPKLQEEGNTGGNPVLPGLQAGSLHYGESLQTLAPQPSALGQIRQFQPFPTDCLPEPIRNFVTGYARAMNCDESFLAVPVLTVLAASIGNTRRIQLKAAWSEPPILWTAIVADSGTRKSPPLDLATSPLWEMQSRAFDRHVASLNDYQGELANYRQNVRDVLKFGGRMPTRPVEPTAARYVVSDLAIEPLALLLGRQPRGLLVCCDELDGWLNGFDSSRGRQGASWLELHGGRPFLLDRGSGTIKTTFVRAASVCVTGGIQPAILSARLTKSQLSSGLFARLLFAFPPDRPRRWEPADADLRLYVRYGRVLIELLQLEFAQGMDGAPIPYPVTLTPEAQQRFSRFVDEFEQDADDADPALTASFSKLEGYAARFALVLHLTRWASGETVDKDVCDETSMERGIRLSHWFANEARRVHSMLCETLEAASQRKLVEWLHKRGG